MQILKSKYVTWNPQPISILECSYTWNKKVFRDRVPFYELFRSMQGALASCFLILSRRIFSSSFYRNNWTLRLHVFDHSIIKLSSYLIYNQRKSWCRDRKYEKSNHVNKKKKKKVRLFSLKKKPILLISLTW